MLRALLISFAMLSSMLAAMRGPCAAQNTAPVAGIRSNQVDPSGDDSTAENELLGAANRSRELAGVAPLRMEAALREAARTHARQMVANQRLDHQFPGEPSLMQRIALVASMNGPLSELRIDRAGENVADASRALQAHESLMHSPPHRENLLDPRFNVVGVGAIWSKGRLYVVQDFAHELPSYSAPQAGKLVSQSVDEIRQQAGLPDLAHLTPAKLDEAACSLAKENHPNAHLLATAYENPRIVAYTQSRPEVLPQAALPLLRDPAVRQVAIGTCYARNPAYPTGTYWVAILLY